MICPKCNQEGAKKSHSYHDIVAHKCDGFKVGMVGYHKTIYPSYKDKDRDINELKEKQNKFPRIPESTKPIDYSKPNKY